MQKCVSIRTTQIYLETKYGQKLHVSLTPFGIFVTYFNGYDSGFAKSLKCMYFTHSSFLFIKLCEYFNKVQENTFSRQKTCNTIRV